MDNKEILNLKLDSDDFDKDMTIGDYFKELLVTLWREGEGFSGKRPFGNSGWEYDVYKPLIGAGVVDGELDEDGYVRRVNITNAEEFIIKLIKSAFDS